VESNQRLELFRAAGQGVLVRRLILNADDFGMTRGVNEGIVRGHREGILTSTTLMATGDAFDDAVAKAKATPTLGVGCHVVLTGGVAVLPPKEIPSLASPDGTLPESLPAFVARVTSGSIRIEEVEAEIRAQVAKIRAAGIEPTHLDSHKHTHAHPRVTHAFGRVARELKIRCIRKPVEDLKDSWDSSSEAGGSSLQLAAAGAVRVVSAGFDSARREYGLNSPDQFLGLATTGQLGPSALAALIRRVQDGSTEIMLHPGICDDDLRRLGGRLHEQREMELKGLLAAESKQAVADCGIQLITYREL
jgi:hopanoid biosynthesis associated protein HpnK